MNHLPFPIPPLFAVDTQMLMIAGGAIVFVVLVALGTAALFAQFYRKVGPEEAIVRSGSGGLHAATGAGIWVIPVMHRADRMDLSVKRIEISRRGQAGLICQDNIRADIEVAFFVRVNNTRDHILQVAQSLGCNRASDIKALVELFDAKFSEALKTVGKRFDFVELYNERDKFKAEILKVIGTDLNGYVLDDCAIDTLEQTPLEMLNPNNILDAEGIKKITDLTSREHIISNEIQREKEKTIKKQDVEAREKILELERQQIEAEQKQHRECAEVSAREQAQAAIIQQQERLKSEQARIRTEEEMAIAEENKLRQIVVASKNKERTNAVETERVEKDRMLEATERERVVGVAQVEREKAIEVERRNIQEVIRERVAVERAVVEEQERIKDTQEFAGADRRKKVAITAAEQSAQESMVKDVKSAEAAKQVASLAAEQKLIEADADRAAAERRTQSMKMLAEGRTAEEAAPGLAEAQVVSAKADAIQKQGSAEAAVIERKAVAEAKGQEAKAVATEKLGTAEAEVLKRKLNSEATGIEQKANAMKLLDGVGREHEEFKLRLNKDRDIEIAAIQAQREIADSQSKIVAEALRTANIDIVGGDTQFFDKIVNAVRTGKVVDRLVLSSQVATDVKNTFFNGSPEHFRDQLRYFVGQFNLSAEDVKDLSIATMLGKLSGLADNDTLRTELARLLGLAHSLGLSENSAATLDLPPVKSAAVPAPKRSKA